jgi:flavin-binding protein dodecin
MAEKKGQTIVETTVEARGAERGPTVRNVLVWSLGLVIVAMAVVWFVFFRTWHPDNLMIIFGKSGERWERPMTNHIYKVVELVGSSETSIEDAISAAIAKANKTIRNMDWFEVVQTRGHIENGKIGHYQVTLKIGFTLEGWYALGPPGSRPQEHWHAANAEPSSDQLKSALPQIQRGNGQRGRSALRRCA